jgi:hypothetical protein
MTFSGYVSRQRALGYIAEPLAELLMRDLAEQHRADLVCVRQMKRSISYSKNLGYSDGWRINEHV